MSALTCLYNGVGVEVYVQFPENFCFAKAAIHFDDRIYEFPSLPRLPVDIAIGFLCKFGGYARCYGKSGDRGYIFYKGNVEDAHILVGREAEEFKLMFHPKSVNEPHPIFSHKVVVDEDVTEIYLFRNDVEGYTFQDIEMSLDPDFEFEPSLKSKRKLFFKDKYEEDNKGWLDKGFKKMKVVLTSLEGESLEANVVNVDDYNFALGVIRNLGGTVNLKTDDGILCFTTNTKLLKKAREKVGVELCESIAQDINIYEDVFCYRSKEGREFEYRLIGKD